MSRRDVEWHAILQDEPWSLNTSLYVWGYDSAGSIHQLELGEHGLVITVKPIGEYEEGQLFEKTTPLLRVKMQGDNIGIFQAIRRALNNEDYLVKPDKQEIGRIEKHLEDMRRLVFKDKYTV